MHSAEVGGVGEGEPGERKRVGSCWEAKREKLLYL
jgi:hypothetical protein